MGGLHLHGRPLVARWRTASSTSSTAGRPVRAATARSSARACSWAWRIARSARDRSPCAACFRSTRPWARDGYPLLFQTGETADGFTPLVDRQHPHDFLMELAAVYSVPLGATSSVFRLLRAVRASRRSARRRSCIASRACAIPDAPLSHHWLDATHITFGVATLGVSKGPFQLEGSWFNGREPDQHRWNIETRRFDSWSARFSYNPTAELSMQVSHGDLKSPEQLEADTRVQPHHRLHQPPRETATRNGQRPSPRTQTAIRRPRRRRPSQAGCSSPPTCMRNRHTFFGRAEQVHNSELFDEGRAAARPSLSDQQAHAGLHLRLGKDRSDHLGHRRPGRTSQGPSRLDPYYGNSERSYMVFLQGRL